MSIYFATGFMIRHKIERYDCLSNMYMIIRFSTSIRQLTLQRQLQYCALCNPNNLMWDPFNICREWFFFQQQFSPYGSCQKFHTLHFPFQKSIIFDINSRWAIIVDKLDLSTLLFGSIYILVIPVFVMETEFTTGLKTFLSFYKIRLP